MKKRRSQQNAQGKKQPRTSRPRPSLSSEHGERQSQVTLQMRESLHQELARKAFNAGMTMRGFIMQALKQSGLHVAEEDLIDRRRRTPWGPSD